MSDPADGARARNPARRWRSSVLDQRIKRLMFLRVVMFTTLLLIAIYVETVSEVLAPVNPLYFLIVATYALTILYGIALRLRVNPAVHAHAQLLMDIVVITGLVYVTGGTGAHAGFILLFPICVLAGSVILYRNSGLTLALVATLMYAALLWLVRNDWLPAQGPSELRQIPVKQLLYSVFVTGVACFTVALIGSYLSESLKRVGQRLEEATEEVADLKELNVLIVNSIHSGLMTTDVSGHVLYLNPFGESILGVKAGALRGRHAKEVFGTPALDRTMLTVRAASETLARLDATYRRPDGAELMLGLTLTPLATLEPRHGGYLLVFQDLTKIRQLEEEVRLNERLAAAGEMAAQLAHEIRNPLGSISGSAQVLLAEASVPPEQERLLGIITRESKRLSDTLNQFLMLTRPKGHQTMVPVDLHAVIAEAVTLLRHGPEVGQAHRVDFVADEGPLVCMADRNQILQVFWNLARNGLEAMPDGGALRVELRRTGEELVLTVRDQGGGMSAETHRRLFQPFVSSTPMGTGLGLAIVYQIVRGWNGDIGVRSVPPRGTEVEVRLPQMTVAVPAPQ